MTTAQPGEVLPPAPYGRRVFAAIIDGALGVVATLPTMIGVITGDPLSIAGLAGLGIGAVLLVGLAVLQLVLTARGGSIGSRMLGLGVRRDGAQSMLGIGRTLLRWLVLGASGIVPVLGTALMLASILMDPQRRGRGWHDLAAGSLAVDARGARAAQSAPAAASAPRPQAHTVAADEPYRPGQLSAPSLGAAQPLIDAVPGGAPVLGGAPVPGSAPMLGSGPMLGGPPTYGAPPVGPLLGGPVTASAVPEQQADVRAEAQPGASDAARWRPPTAANPAAQPSVPASSSPAYAPPAPVQAQGPIASTDASADEVDEATVRRAPVADAGLDPDLERTHVVRRGPAATVRLDDGEPFRITGLALLGRNPAAAEGETVAHLVPLGDESRTVSKTHVALRPTADGLVVVDRGSTNGSALLHAGQRSELEPGRSMLAITGDVVELGDHRLEVLDHAG